MGKVIIINFLMAFGFAIASYGTADQIAKMDELDYVEFELEVEYADDQVYEAELERKRGNRVKAEIEDSRNGVRKKSEEAFDELFPLVERLSITPETEREEAIREILAFFELSDDYEEFELELKFKDGTKSEFKDEK